jgi:uncharacterized protein (DUF1778 family)
MSMEPQRAPNSHTKPVNLRVREDIRALIDQAARAQGRSRSDFMIEAARMAAENAILDQTVIGVDAERYARFVALLDAPTLPNEKIRKTLLVPAPWE